MNIGELRGIAFHHASSILRRVVDGLLPPGNALGRGFHHDDVLVLIYDQNRLLDFSFLDVVVAEAPLIPRICNILPACVSEETKSKITAS